MSIDVLSANASSDALETQASLDTAALAGVHGSSDADDPMELAIQAKQLRKNFGALTAVDGVDFGVRRGEYFGFLGVNGAGKTTTIRMIQCLSPPTSGELRVLGMDVQGQARRIKSRLGVVPQQDNVDPDLRVRENLLVYARYFGIPRRKARARADELLEFVQLDERAESPVTSLSGGMKRRLVLARAMINRPELMLLDEPTTGLDPQARHLVWSRLRRLRSAGVTTLLTTHYMEEAAQLCDRVAIIDGGRLLAVGEPEALVTEHVGRVCIEIRPAPGGRQQLHAVLQGLSGQRQEVGDTVYLYPGEHDSEADWRALQALPNQRLVHRPAALEDLFLRLTGRDPETSASPRRGDLDE